MKALILVVRGLAVQVASAASTSWKADSIQLSVTSSEDLFRLQLTASRYVIPSTTTGHFKLSVTRDGVGTNTSCISYGASGAAVVAILDLLDPISDLGGSTVIREGDGSSSTFKYGFVYNISATDPNVNLVDSIDVEVAGSGVDHDCARLSTSGYWSEDSNWNTGAVPTSTDEVTIPIDAGFVILTDNVTISSLQMNGGAILTDDSTCLSGWTPAPGGTLSSFGGNKCYRTFDNASSWTAAQNACSRAVSPRLAPEPSQGGALRGALVTIQGLEENNWVARMCQGNSIGRDCWIGMTRGYRGLSNAEAGNDLEWAELGNAVGGSRYRSWATREPSDFEGDEAGEHCVAIQHSKRQAQDQGEARWYDDECQSEKPFVCQAFGVSTPFFLTISTELKIAGGYLVGAGAVISSTLAQQVTGAEGEVGITNGATLQNSGSGSMEWSAPSAIGWGGTLVNMGTLFFSTAILRATHDSAGVLEDNAGAWPILINKEGAEILFAAGSEVDLEWLLWNEGGSMVVEGELHCTGGGYSPSGTLTVDVGGEARFSDSSLVMYQTQVVVVTLKADREVTGQDSKSITGTGGFYRLAFGGDETSCIDYHASADTLQAALEDIISIEEEGGVSIRRDGDGGLKRWDYGYRYTVTFDGARSLSSSNTLVLSCAGSADDCDCVDLSGAISGPGGSRVGCGSTVADDENEPLASTSAEYNSSECLVQTTIELETLREGAETIVEGGGTLIFSTGGQYFLPSEVTADLEVLSDAVVVCPQLAAELVGAVNVSSGGVLWFSGADLDALNAVDLLHAEPETPGRAGAAVASPPTFNATVEGDVNVHGGGEIRLAATASASLTIRGSLSLAGGGLSGQGRVVVEGPTLVLVSGASTIEDQASSLRNGLILDMQGGGAWSGGGVQAKDGVIVLNRGLVEVSAGNGAWFGHGGDFGARAKVDFDGQGWYPNPLCGGKCMVEPAWENRESGVVIGTEGCDSLFGFVLHNEGIVIVKDHGRVEWCGTGPGGGNGTIILPGSNSTIVFSDGGYVFGTTANVTGLGVLEFSGGTGHELPKHVSALVKVTGQGAVTFAGGSLSLGGVTVEDTGALVFSSATSSTFISGDLSLRDNGLIIFPFPSVYDSLVIAGGGSWVEAPWGVGEGDLDGGGGWGTASRSSLTVQGDFDWSGGSMSGNARIICAGESQWSDGGSGSPKSTKNLLNSLHLLNRGNIVWSHGDVIVSNGAAFVNQGTLLLEETGEEIGDATTTSAGKVNDVAPRIRTAHVGEGTGWRRGSSSVLVEAILSNGDVDRAGAA
ncbi:unnamed protein product, partial [Scytosiphon promiscuus]